MSVLASLKRPPVPNFQEQDPAPEQEAEALSSPGFLRRESGDGEASKITPSLKSTNTTNSTFTPTSTSVTTPPTKAERLKRWLAAERAAFKGQPFSAEFSTLLAEDLSAVLQALFVHILEVVGFSAASAASPSAKSALPPLALVALGGLGRQECAPYGDIDLVIVTNEPQAPLIREVADAFFYTLWDAKLEVGHAVRSPADFAALAEQDATVLTTAIDWRFLAGSAVIKTALEQQLRPVLAGRAAHAYIQKLSSEESALFHTARPVFALQPEVKRGPGGLRAIQQLWWVAKLLWRITAFADLEKQGILDQASLQALLKAREFLLGVRFALHFLAGRKQDQLLFEFQDDVAAYLGLTSLSLKQSAADQLLQQFYHHAQAVQAITGRFWARGRLGQFGVNALFKLIKKGRDPVQELDNLSKCLLLRQAPEEYLENLDKSLDESLSKNLAQSLDGRESSLALFHGQLTFRTPEQLREHPQELLRIFLVALQTGYPLYVHAAEMLSSAASGVLPGEFAGLPSILQLAESILVTEATAKRTLETYLAAVELRNNVKAKKAGALLGFGGGAVGDSTRNTPLGSLADSPKYAGELLEQTEIALLKLAEDLGAIDNLLSKNAYLWLLMHELGVLVVWLPEFKAVTGLVQRDLYHVYTVDIHLLYCLSAVQLLLASADVREAEKLPFYTYLQDPAARQILLAAAKGLTRSKVLLLAALLHDVGKGAGSNHSARGALIAQQVALRLGYSPEDVEDVRFLIQEHVTMFHLSQRRDLEDQTLITRFARQVETKERLDMLLLLSYADALTTGKEACTRWRLSLLFALYKRTEEALKHGDGLESSALRVIKRLQKVRQTVQELRLQGALTATAPEQLESLLSRVVSRHVAMHPTAVLLRHLEAVAAAESAATQSNGLPIAVKISADQRALGLEIIVVGPDRPGLLADLSGVLAAAGVSVVTASISGTTDGLAIDTFMVNPTYNKSLLTRVDKQATLSQELILAVQGVQAYQAALNERRLRMKLQQPAGGLTPRVVYDLDASKEATVLDFFAPDRIGLLYEVTLAIFQAGASIVLAKVNTEGTRAVDSFYLVNAHTLAPLSASERLSLEKALLALDSA